MLEIKYVSEWLHVARVPWDAVVIERPAQQDAREFYMTGSEKRGSVEPPLCCGMELDDFRGVFNAEF